MPKDLEIHTSETINTGESIGRSIHDSTGNILSLYTTILPKLEYKTSHLVKSLDVVVSAAKTEDTFLMHKLLTKLRKDV